MTTLTIIAVAIATLYVAGVGIAALSGTFRRAEAGARWDDDEDAERAAGARMIVRSPLWPIDATRAIRKSWQDLLDDARKADNRPTAAPLRGVTMKTTPGELAEDPDGA